MKRLFILLLLAGVFSGAYCQGERSAEEALFKRITATDSGFLLKKEAMQISAIVNIIDSVNKKYEDYKIEDIERQYKEGEITEEQRSNYLKYIEGKKEEKKREEYKTESDTIAKYYKKNNGNYIVAIQYSFLDYYSGSNILIEFSSQGKFLKQAIYYHCYCCFPCGNFNKHGDFFSLETSSCAMGGYYSSDLYIFKEIAPEDSLNNIPFWCYTTETGDYDSIENKYIDWGCDGTIKKIENDSLIITYSPRGEIWGEGEDYDKVLKTIEKESFDILYIYKNNRWYISNKEDYEKLENTTCLILFIETL